MPDYRRGESGGKPLYVVGAGPGDPELLTIKARRLLSRADLIAYDDLIHPKTLSYAKADCRLLSVGYRGRVHDDQNGRNLTGEGESQRHLAHPPHPPHPLVNPEILTALSQGLTVVRLKCGDPMIFGRSAEEEAVLNKSGFACCYVPGISAVLGAASALGVPLTDRRLSSSVLITTGHYRAGSTQSSAELATSAVTKPGTIVVYMPRKSLIPLCESLVQGGWDPKTPLVFIASATTASQDQIRATLDDLGPLKDALGGHQPGLAMIGPTVNLATKAVGQERLPLAGKRVMVLRSHGGKSRAATQLRSLGADVVEYPLFTARSLVSCEPRCDIDGELANPAANELKSLFLNTHAWQEIYLRGLTESKMFLRSLCPLGLDIRAVAVHKKIVTKSAKTADYLERRGLKVNLLKRWQPSQRTLIPCYKDEPRLTGIPWPCFEYQTRSTRVNAPAPSLVIAPHHRALDLFCLAVQGEKSQAPDLIEINQSGVGPDRSCKALGFDWRAVPWVGLGPSLAARLGTSLGVLNASSYLTLAELVAELVTTMTRAPNDVAPPQESQGILPSSRPLILDESLKPRGPQTELPKGQIIVYTGQGKGKTTAALGLMFRALGHAHRVAVVQFIKGKWPTGERKAAAEFLPELEFHVMGKGFTWDSDDLSQDRRMARSAWDKARQLIETGGHQVVILDEVTYVTNYGFVELGEILSCLANRPKNVSVVLTGRRAHPDLVAMADVVTEMQEIKHPFKSGTKAQKGLDF